MLAGYVDIHRDWSLCSASGISWARRGLPMTIKCAVADGREAVATRGSAALCGGEPAWVWLCLAQQGGNAQPRGWSCLPSSSIAQSWVKPAAGRAGPRSLHPLLQGAPLSGPWGPGTAARGLLAPWHKGDRKNILQRASSVEIIRQKDLPACYIREYACIREESLGFERCISMVNEA